MNIYTRTCSVLLKVSLIIKLDDKNVTTNTPTVNTPTFTAKLSINNEQT